MSTPFWFKDISILYNQNYLLEIIPKKEYDFSRKLNAVVRFAIYYSILLYIFKRDGNILCFPFITIVITVFLHRTNRNEKNDDANSFTLSDSMSIDGDENDDDEEEDDDSITELSKPRLSARFGETPKAKKEGKAIAKEEKRLRRELRRKKKLLKKKSL